MMMTMDPPAHTDVVGLYEQLADAVKRMLELARAKEWTALPDLDAQCTAIVNHLHSLEPQMRSLDPLERARAMGLITSIQADQAELDALVKPQFARLMRRIDTLQRQEKLHGAYGAPPEKTPAP